MLLLCRLHKHCGVYCVLVAVHCNWFVYLMHLQYAAYLVLESLYPVIGVDSSHTMDAKLLLKSSRIAVQELRLLIKSECHYWVTRVELL